MAACIHHAVDHGRAAQSFAARNIDPPAAQVGFGLAFEVPVQIPPGHVLGEGHGHVLEQSRGRAARFEQQDLGLRILRQAVRQYAARRTCADNDVIELVCRTARHVIYSESAAASPTPGLPACAPSTLSRSAQSERAFIRQRSGFVSEICGPGARCAGAPAAPRVNWHSIPVITHEQRRSRCVSMKNRPTAARWLISPQR